MRRFEFNKIIKSFKWSLVTAQGVGAGRTWRQLASADDLTEISESVDTL